MVMINGPLITTPVVIPEHTEQRLDPGAYWNLDFDGSLLPEGAPLTLLYAKQAWPTLRAAQEQFRTQQLALETQRSRKGQRS